MLLPSAGLGDQLKGIQIAVKSSKQQQQQHKYPRGLCILCELQQTVPGVKPSYPQDGLFRQLWSPHSPRNYILHTVMAIRGWYS
jgi:hypothetical protein